MQKIKAPFTADQVETLNYYQAIGVWHPYTCTNGHDLIAYAEGWKCPHCSYTQDWAFDMDRAYLEDLKAKADWLDKAAKEHREKHGDHLL